MLRQHIGDRKEGLLFTNADGNMILDFRNLFGKAMKLGNINKFGTPKTFRHTYMAIRLQTADNGTPVGVWQVACELGQRDTGLIERTDGHLLKTRDRAAVVQYGEAKVVRHSSARAG